ncbi:MAG TPA: hypothetical protein VK178_03090 [Opitutaceae bacterium]|nr:hypothetical protein [Opitutaceae bacterium]
MPSIPNADNVIADTTNMLAIWNKNPTIQIKNMTLADMTANNALLSTTVATIVSKEKELIPTRNLRDDLSRKLHNNCVQLRKAFAGCLGLDASEVEQAGGTRASERKAPKRRTPKTKSAPNA